MRLPTIAIVLLMMCHSAAAWAESPPPASPLTYADLADLAADAPVAAHVRIREAIPLKPDRAPDVAPGHSRFYVEADIVSLLRAPQGLPMRIRYLADLPNLGGKAPRIARKSDYLVFGTPVRGRPDELQLSAPDALVRWTPEEEARLRPLLAEAAAPEAPPRITGVGNAFHVPGTLPGESETQIFLQAENGRPVSLTILRRPGQQTRWAVALGEIVDEAAEPPQPQSLLWYRLACSLPPMLPPESLHDSDPAAAAAVRNDYALVMGQLGACVRNRSR